MDPAGPDLPALRAAARRAVALPAPALLAECEEVFFTAVGPGGQHRNKTESGVRLTHRGELRNCLFGRADVPLRHLLGLPDWEERIERTLRRAILDKPERHRLEDRDDGDLHSLVRVGG